MLGRQVPGDADARKHRPGGGWIGEGTSVRGQGTGRYRHYGKGQVAGQQVLGAGRGVQEPQEEHAAAG